MEGKAILYADKVTGSMRRCLDETERRRAVQTAFNEEHDITPETIRKTVEEIEFSTRFADARGAPAAKVSEPSRSYADEVNTEEYIKILEQEMAEAAESLDYERAALIRDQIFELKVSVGK